MQLSTTPPTSHRPFIRGPTVTAPFRGRIAKWYLPAVAMIGIGFGISNYYTTQVQSQYEFAEAEQERLRRNQQLMDAYGDKDNVQDLQRALDTYRPQ
ncbi:hypothetical protein BDW42DRAFT_197704 [Aspergillus taichungensis]|uniref:Cytochrome c oxidase assembly protein n=1 Tax=Aspergillus taichungensis TaxID=482145 RepID=A0A2J5HF72_9EURO|nr:hypothetical protein BDW42DRAFT_197704 [Aspergillus taichungensis]